MILNRIDDQTNKLRELRSQVNDYKTLVKNAVTEEIESREQHWSTEKELIMNRLNLLEEREENRSKREKKNNLVLRGLQLTTNDKKPEVSNFFTNELKVDVGIDDVSFFRTAKGSQLTIVKDSSFDEKRLVMQSRNNIADSQISITSDRTKKEKHKKI
ncbi:hypothetical protein QAD02_013981 [Eretmocerus hayati]|uniref:Uncharacterized protein n=1 Tax=Eretmocerus hayati TaxID=131215 RepID=A0ACC2P4F0_9HYME|nr:hypothetical protein QAD02_013981 [Eretmocerus hayati]